MKAKIAYAACRGTAHMHEGIPCQDAVGGIKVNHAAAIALADGAGSCALAKIGAEAAVSAMLSQAQMWLYGVIPCSDEEAIERVLSVCHNAMKEQKASLQDQACTLLFCIVDQDGQYLCGHIGDGYIFTVDERGADLLSDAENGTDRSETFFLTDPDAKKHFRLYRGKLSAGEAVMLCSDGAGEALFHRATFSCAPVVTKVAQWLLHSPELEVTEALKLNMDRVMRDFSYDDISICVLGLVEDQTEED